MENFERYGFRQVHDMKKGDVILMQIGSKLVNHAAVYIGNNQIKHHLYNRLSSREIYGGWWRKCTRIVVRYEGTS